VLHGGTEDLNYNEEYLFMNSHDGSLYYKKAFDNLSNLPLVSSNSYNVYNLVMCWTAEIKFPVWIGNFSDLSDVIHFSGLNLFLNTKDIWKPFPQFVLQTCTYL
jgi:hypothetical protein